MLIVSRSPQRPLSVSELKIDGNKSRASRDISSQQGCAVISGSLEGLINSFKRYDENNRVPRGHLKNVLNVNSIHLQPLCRSLIGCDDSSGKDWCLKLVALLCP